MRRAGLLLGTVLAASGTLAACGFQPEEPNTPTQAPASPTETSGTRTSSGPLPPLREVPPQQQRELAAVPAGELCGLLPLHDLQSLAFPVQPGVSRQISTDPPVRDCAFRALDGSRSVVLAAQPAGFHETGRDEWDLDGVPMTMTRHAAGCTAFSPVRGATLQVSVTKNAQREWDAASPTTTTGTAPADPANPADPGNPQPGGGQPRTTSAPSSSATTTSAGGEEQCRTARDVARDVLPALAR